MAPYKILPPDGSVNYSLINFGRGYWQTWALVEDYTRRDFFVGIDKDGETGVVDWYVHDEYSMNLARVHKVRSYEMDTVEKQLVKRPEKRTVRMVRFMLFDRTNLAHQMLFLDADLIGENDVPGARAFEQDALRRMSESLATAEERWKGM